MQARHCSAGVLRDRHSRTSPWVRKIAATAGALEITRFDMKYSSGTLAHDRMMRSIEFYGSEVIPRVRELMASPGDGASAQAA
jgi:hypothetical protein